MRVPLSLAVYHESQTDSSTLASNQICYEYEQLARKEKNACQTKSEDEDVFWLFRVL